MPATTDTPLAVSVLPLYSHSPDRSTPGLPEKVDGSYNASGMASTPKRRRDVAITIRVTPEFKRLLEAVAEKRFRDNMTFAIEELVTTFAKRNGIKPGEAGADEGAETDEAG